MTAYATDLWPVVHALVTWGDSHAAPDGPPRVFEHRDCGAIDDRRRCVRCGSEVTLREVRTLLVPGAPVPA